MEKIVIAKTVLSIMPRVDGVRRMIFERNNSLAIHSMNDAHGSLGTMERILDNIWRSDELCDLKIAVLGYVDKMPAKLSQVIKLSFFKNQTSEQIAVQVGVSVRTVFRHLKDGVERFAAGLEKLGLDYVNFKKLIARNKWINDEFQRQQFLVKQTSII